MSAALVADIPNPIDVVAGAVGGAASTAAEATFEFFMRRFAEALERAATKVVTEVAHYLDTSSGVSLDQGWFAGPRAREILAGVALFAAVLMVLFLLAAVLQGLAQGDPMLMVRAAAVEAPVSVFIMVVLTAVTGALLALTDGASSMVLSNADQSLGRFLNLGQPGSILTLGLLGVAMLVVFILGAVLVWIELVVRSSLIYLLLAFAPLVLAARVWPTLRGAWHQLCRIGLALIISKFAIALALALGVAAIGGGGPTDGDLGTQAGLSIGAVVVGACLMLLAAFVPFVILKLLPVFEAAVLAQGISRGPARAGQTAVQSGYYFAGLKRLAGGGGASGGGAGGGGGSGPSPGGGGGAPSAPGAAGASAGGPGAPAPAAAPSAATTTSAGAGAGAGAGGAGVAAGGVAVAAPAAAAVVPVALAAKARGTAAQTADTVSDSVPAGGEAR